MILQQLYRLLRKLADFAPVYGEITLSSNAMGWVDKHPPVALGEPAAGPASLLATP